jgi:hypothetical protein
MQGEHHARGSRALRNSGSAPVLENGQPDFPEHTGGDIALDDINEGGHLEDFVHMEDVDAAEEDPTILPADTLVIERDRDRAVK